MKTLITLIVILSIISCSKEYVKKQAPLKFTSGSHPVIIYRRCDHGGDLVLYSTGPCTSGRIYFGTAYSDTTELLIKKGDTLYYRKKNYRKTID